MLLLPSCGGYRYLFFFNINGCLCTRKMNNHCAFCLKSGANHFPAIYQHSSRVELGPVQELTNKCEGGALRLLKDHLAVTHHQAVVDLLRGGVKKHSKPSVSTFLFFFLLLSCRSQNNVNFNVGTCSTV